jgi:flagellar basal-body rod protein FlgF
MVRGILTSAGGMRPALWAQSILSHNLANASTSGFRQERLGYAQPTGAARTASGARAGAPELVTRLDPTPGAYEVTDRPLDLALQGDGYFAVQTPEGERYTRAGHFLRAEDGTLVTPQGHPLLADGGPIVLPAGAELQVAADGTLRAGEQNLGRLRLVSFGPETPLAPAGAGLLAAQGEAATAAGLRVQQGVLEGPNVTPVQAMVEMISLLRHFEMNQKALQVQDESLGQLLNWVRD